MKNPIQLLTLASTLVLGTTLAQAASFDETLASSPEAVFASKNYEALHHNDDGRVTIVGPKFGSADGTVRYISSASNNNGVCALFGFGASVDEARLTSGNLERTVVIGSDSMFESFRNISYSNAANANSRILSIMCENAADTTASTRLHDRTLNNDDGTITLRQPSFGYSDGTDRWISSTSDLNGVCKRFGYGAAVSSGMLSAGNLERTVVLGSDGRFVKFKNIAYGSNNANSRITSLVCKPTAAR